MMMSCKKATFLMEKSSEVKLSSWEKLQLKLHTVVCKSCAWFYKQSAFLGKHAAKLEEHVESKLSEEQKLEMEKALAKQ